MSSLTCLPRPETLQLPILHVEARVKSNDGLIIRTDLIRGQITQWLIDNFAVLSLKQEICTFDGFKPNPQVLDSIVVTECTGIENCLESGAYRVQNVELDVQAYQLRSQAELDGQQSQQTESGESNDDAPKAKIISLPNKELDGLWESLQFDEPIQSTLLRAISRMVSFSARKFNKWTINWNKLILFWGPPGTGKTSFCRGLAQKLAIRLGKHYPQSKLVEINAHSLGSKFFGESGKLVSRMFDQIETMLEEEEDTFFCVFIDEIETLASRRDRSLSGNEPFDAIRAVNAVLTGLDKLRRHSNVVVISTSNSLRCRAIYEIYRDCLEELSRRGIVEGATFDVVQANPDDPETPLQYVEQSAETLLIPGYDEMVLNFQMFPDAAPTQLADMASASVGISGRTLRRLPALSLVLHSNHTRCDIRVALEALGQGIEAEKRATGDAAE